MTVKLVIAFTTSALAQFEIGEIPKPKEPPRVFLTEFVSGLGYQSDDSFYLGRYGGSVERGWYGFVDGTFRGRADWDSDRTTFWDVRAAVANPNRFAVSATYGEQGVWRIAGFADAFTRFHTETGRTPFIGAGTSELRLPSTWNNAASALLLTGLREPLNPLELKTDWRSAGGEAVLDPRNGYQLRVRYDFRDRSGLVARGLSFGHESNFPSGLFFPLPVAYTTNRFTVTLSHADAAARWTWDASYGFHGFDEANAFVRVQNPYGRSIGQPWPGGAFAGYPRSFAQYSTPPDNVAHRFAARLSYTVQKQDDPFLPYSPVAQLAVVQPVPRDSLDGKVRKTFASLSMTAREWDTVDLAASYTYDDRENLTPIDLYNYIPGDAQDQAQPFVAGVSRYIRFNLPHSFNFQKVKAEAGIRPMTGTRLSLSYTGDFKDRDYQQVDETNENTLLAKALATFSRASGWVSAAYIKRTGSPYNDAAAWDASHTVAYLNAGPQNRSIEYPQLYRYYLANRKRTEFKGGVTFDATDAFTVSAGGGHARDNYDRSLFGLRRSRSLIANADIAYAVRDLLTASAFYTYERFTFAQKGYFIFGISLTNPRQEWTAESRDSTHTAGAQVDWQAVPDKLKVIGSYALSDGSAATDVDATGFTPLAAVSPLPDVVERTEQASVAFDYTFRPGLAVRVGYLHEKHTTRDWAYDNVAIAPVSQLIGMGIAAPRYGAHIVTLATRVAY
jgi:MtrB/PioB family decaheme-associated outer membrane protein